MTAPALNLAQIAVPGAAGPNAAGAQADAPTTGFDALIAALFPPADAAVAPTTGLPASEGGGKDAATETPDAAATLAGAAVFQNLPAAIETPPPTTVSGEAGELPRRPAADGKERAAFVLSDRGLPPGLAGKGELVAEAEGGAEPDSAPPPGRALKAEHHAGSPAAPAFGHDKAPGVPDPAAPAFGRDKALGVPAPPALENASPKAGLAAKVAAADVVEAPAPTPEAAAATAKEAAKSPALTAQVARPEPAPTSPTKPAKAERAKGAAEARNVSDALRPVEAAGGPVHAKAAQAAAKTASHTVEAFEPKTGEGVKGDADQPDAAQQGETRAGSQSSAATAHAANAARGAPETVASLAAQIVKGLEAKTTRFDIELDPAGLGRVDVRIEIGAHGKMTASMVFENPQAAHELKSRAAELQRALEQAGFDLSEGLSFDVSDHGRHPGQAWQDQAEMGRGFRGQAFRAALETAGEAVDAANTGALRLRRGVSAGVDVRI